MRPGPTTYATRRHAVLVGIGAVFAATGRYLIDQYFPVSPIVIATVAPICACFIYALVRMSGHRSEFFVAGVAIGLSGVASTAVLGLMYYPIWQGIVVLVVAPPASVIAYVVGRAVSQR